MIPLMLVRKLDITRKLRKNRVQNNDESKQFKKWKIFNLAINDLRSGDTITQLLAGGFINIEYSDCIINPGVQYLDKPRIRKIMSFFSNY